MTSLLGAAYTSSDDEDTSLPSDGSSLGGPAVIAAPDVSLEVSSRPPQC